MSQLDDHQGSAAHLQTQVEALIVSATRTRDFGEAVATEAAENGITGDYLGRALDAMTAADMLIISLTDAKSKADDLVAALAAMA